MQEKSTIPKSSQGVNPTRRVGTEEKWEPGLSGGSSGRPVRVNPSEIHLTVATQTDSLYPRTVWRGRKAGRGLEGF